MGVIRRDYLDSARRVFDAARFDVTFAAQSHFLRYDDPRSLARLREVTLWMVAAEYEWYGAVRDRQLQLGLDG